LLEATRPGLATGSIGSRYPAARKALGVFGLCIRPQIDNRLHAPLAKRLPFGYQRRGFNRKPSSGGIFL
jgi:hypothetical protein